MVSVLEADFFLSEILGRGVFLRQQRIGLTEDLLLESRPVAQPHEQRRRGLEVLVRREHAHG